MDANPLITGLEHRNITRCWVSPLVMHWSIFNWFLGHVTFSFVFIQGDSCSIGPVEWLGRGLTFHFIALKNWSLSSYTLRHCPMNSKAFSWLGADAIAWNTSQFILLCLSAFTSSTIQGNQFDWHHSWHAMTLPLPPSSVDEVACVWIMGDSFLFPLPMTLVLGGLCPYKCMLFQNY